MSDTLQVRPDDDLRMRAIRRLKKRSDFHAHLLVYTLVNGAFVAIWAVTGAHFFWPIFPMLGWGIGLVMNAWDVYWAQEPDEAQIRHEMDRLTRA